MPTIENPLKNNPKGLEKMAQRQAVLADNADILLFPGYTGEFF